MRKIVFFLMFIPAFALADLCGDQKKLYIQAIKWRESGISEQDAKHKMKEIYRKKASDKNFKASESEYFALVDNAYQEPFRTPDNSNATAEAIHTVCEALHSN
nr:hypothetical protein [Acinetobacter sp. Marseille-Q1620]